MTISKTGMRSMAVAISVVSLLTSATSFACGGDWYPEVHIDPRIQGVAQAEKSLAKGDYVAAAGSVVRMMPHIKTLSAKSDPLVARAERVLATAVARSGGRMERLEREVPSEVLAHWQGKSATEQQQSLAWSVNALRSELELKKDDPALQTELGAALSRLEGGQDEARTLLESLAARDLVASPEGYKALAELRSLKGDQAGQQLAMKRCESMASDSKVCSSELRRAS